MSKRTVESAAEPRPVLTLYPVQHGIHIHNNHYKPVVSCGLDLASRHVLVL